MKLPPFKITRPVTVEPIPSTAGAVVTVLADMDLPAGQEQAVAVILLLSKEAKESLLIGLRALQTDPDGTSGLTGAPGSLQ